MILPIIINPTAGKLTLRQKISVLQRACEGQGIQPEIVLTRTGKEIETAARRLGKEERALVAILGGDGSINAAASGLIGRSSTLVVLPGGTRNHFAQDLKIPLDIGAALQLVSEGERALVDVGQVNEEIFLNNSSIGWYPKFVARREEKQKKGIDKRIASIRTALEINSRRSMMSLSLQIDDKKMARETPLLFVANNEYSFAPGSFGARPALEKGALHVYIVKGEQKLPLFSLIKEGLRSSSRSPESIEHYACSKLIVKSPKPFLQVARDGEVAAARPPLRYRILPKALGVLIPSKSNNSHADNRSSF